MNSTLKSSTLVPINKQSVNSLQPPSRQTSQPSLALINSPERLERPNQQQKKAIAQIYVEQAWIYFQDRNWRDAIAACKNALQLNSQNTDAYKIFGNVLKIKGKKAEALGIYAKALEIDPNSAAIYANLGSFYAEQKNWQQALDYYQQAVIIDPRLAGAYRSLARIWEELGDTQQALECLCQAVNLEPETFPAAEYFSFGDRLYQHGQLKEASIFYIHGVELDPQAEAPLAKLVKILEELEDWQQAVIFYHRLMSLSNGETPQPTSAANRPIKDLLSKSSKKTKPQKAAPVKAIAPAAAKAPSQLLPLPETPGGKVFRPASAEQPNSAISWNNLGSTYAQKQKWLKAISCYQEAVDLDPNLTKAYRNLARVYNKVGKKDRAILSWYEAFNLEPNLVKPQEHFALAQRLLQLSQVDKAIACLQHALELQPDFASARSALTKLQKRQGKTNEVKAS
ncbi:MAG: tetratricopeptide repeat protein [Cyanobacteria bacterium J06623_1]